MKRIRKIKSGFQSIRRTNNKRKDEHKISPSLSFTLCVVFNFASDTSFLFMFLAAMWHTYFDDRFRICATKKISSSYFSHLPRYFCAIKSIQIVHLFCINKHTTIRFVFQSFNFLFFFSSSSLN